MEQKNVVVVGAGVAGLTTALLLSKNPQYQITVAAKHMPGDYDIEYASPWAGADYMPDSPAGTAAAEWDRVSWPEFQNLAQNHLDAGVHFQKTVIYTREKDIDSANPKFPRNAWWKELFSDFQDLPNSELPAGIASGSSFTTVCINTAIYLPWLLSRCLSAGVVFKRTNFHHISEVAEPGIHHSGSAADLLVHCSGLSALTLGGVEDRSMYPVRGQIVLVRNNPGGDFSLSGTEDGPEEAVYLMVRAGGGGTVLGGCRQRGCWDSAFGPNLAVRIMTRCVEMCPALTGGKRHGIEHLDIIRHGVGLRPGREGGPRVESEVIAGLKVVHNYGHDGSGYQASYGCAKAAVALVDAALS